MVAAKGQLASACNSVLSEEIPIMVVNGQLPIRILIRIVDDWLMRCDPAAIRSVESKNQDFDPRAKPVLLF